MDPAQKYKEELEELEKTIALLCDEGRQLLSYGELIEVMKLNLEVQKEIYRMAGEKNDL